MALVSTAAFEEPKLDPEMEMEPNHRLDEESYVMNSHNNINPQAAVMVIVEVLTPHLSFSF